MKPWDVARAALAGLREKRASRADRPARWWYDVGTGTAFWSPGAPPGYGRRAWVPVKEAQEAPLRPAFDLLQLTPTALNAPLGGPTPLAAMLAGGLLGAGLGYGGGRLLERLLGEGVLEPGQAARTGMLLGGTAGATPGLALGALGHKLEREDGGSGWGAWTRPNVLFGKEAGAFWREAEAWLDERRPGLLDPGFAKAADLAGAELAMPSIPVDRFGRVVWQDPYLAPPVRAATAGLVEAAGSLAGASAVSPWDVAQVALGMGTGLASGVLVGKTLGALAGLTPAAQHELQRAGVFAGLLTNVVPKAFGG